MLEKIITILVIGSVATTLYFASGVFESINQAMSMSHVRIEDIDQR